jgi:MFS family permease
MMQPAGSKSLGGQFFYGWVIVAVMAVTGGLSMALGSLNFGLFIKPMDDELGLGRAVFGWAQSTRQIASAATAPVVGGLIDRIGVRALLAIAALLTGGALAALAGIGAGWQLVALFGLMGLVGIGGPGALVTVVPVTKWFVRERGRALAFMSLGAPVGGLVFMPLTQVLIDTVGWRSWSSALGASVIVRHRWRSCAVSRRIWPAAGWREERLATGPLRPGLSARPAPADERPDGRGRCARRPYKCRNLFSLVMLGWALGLHLRILNQLDPRLIAIATAPTRGLRLDCGRAAGAPDRPRPSDERRLLLRVPGAGDRRDLTSGHVRQHDRLWDGIVC